MDGFLSDCLFGIASITCRNAQNLNNTTHGSYLHLEFMFLAQMSVKRNVLPSHVMEAVWAPVLKTCNLPCPTTGMVDEPLVVHRLCTFFVEWGFPSCCSSWPCAMMVCTASGQPNIRRKAIEKEQKSLRSNMLDGSTF